MTASAGMSPESPSAIPAVINVGLMGLGVVGTGVAAKLLGKGSPLSDVTGRPVRLKRVLVRDISIPRDIELPEGLLTTNAEEILADPDIQEFYLGIGTQAAASYRNVKRYRRRKRWLS